MEALIRREFQTSNEGLNQERIPDHTNELKARTKEKQWTVETKGKQWTVALSDIPDWPRIEAVAEFTYRTRLLGKTPSQRGVYTQPTCPLCNLN
ncbi:unnamed protein product [Rodentolepis nana]|uniref:Integrase n=1 Tax=Rodentolepis nana TaxID=102285 RepID=A0A0R3TC47_RODNA|nr:unnamed protein product [Rodentolepis nana]